MIVFGALPRSTASHVKKSSALGSRTGPSSSASLINASQTRSVVQLESSAGFTYCERAPGEHHPDDGLHVECPVPSEGPLDLFERHLEDLEILLFDSAPMWLTRFELSRQIEDCLLVTESWAVPESPELNDAPRFHADLFGQLPERRLLGCLTFHVAGAGGDLQKRTADRG